MELTGANLINGCAIQGKGETFRAIEAATGEPVGPDYHMATRDQVADACAASAEAFAVMRNLGLEPRARFLEEIAYQLEAAAEDIIPRVMLETALPEARVRGELGRTCGQLRLFAAEVRDGGWLGIRIDPALPDRTPMPRPDLRLRKIPLGPVAVFGASNFPLAFSVAGGDTASAFAAGCTVVAKAHPAHPGTSERVGRAIQAALEACGLPAGAFALLHGGVEMGSRLVQDPRIKAVGFTGSRAGGLAIQLLAADRPEPIPVYGELSAINPVIVLPEAMKVRGAEIGQGLAGSVAMGAGQFCTNPGLVFALAGSDADYAGFRDALSSTLGQTPPAAMLTPGIAGAYRSGLERLAAHEGVTLAVKGESMAGCQPTAMFESDSATFISGRTLHEEVFGACTLVVRCKSLDEVKSALAAMEGQLTATLQMEDADLTAARALLPTLEDKAGRILVNGFPTGVEVCHAMVHGGPYPSTTDSRTTSVGTLAIDRFLRPVCYQNFPAGLLPEELRDANPLGLRGRVDGQWV